MTTVLFPLSANPITYGHLDIIKQSSLLFDKVVVAIGNNENKKYLINNKSKLKLESFQDITLDYSVDNENIINHLYTIKNNLYTFFIIFSIINLINKY